MMLKFILLRILQFPLILAIVYLVTFMLVWVAPGDPFETSERNANPQVIQQKKERLHARTAWEFLRNYPLNILEHGDFGPSLKYEEWSVNDILKSGLPISATLGFFAIAIATFCGVAIGAAGAARPGGALDWLGLTVALIGISLPGFVTAGLLIMAFSVELKWFPVGSWGTLRAMLLPAIALSLMPMAYIARLTRAAMIDVLSSDYIRTARAKGLSRPAVVIKHALKNAILPVLSYIGPATAAALTGSFVVEKVFNIHGLGEHFVNSILNRDQTLVLGVVMVYSTILLAMNLLVDVGYVLVDPRIDSNARGAA
jgi:ABC-type dipeptide/oligopeptide/nickel transport system permease component